jgi:polyferredoxin
MTLPFRGIKGVCQTTVYHIDLPQTLLKNSSYKMAMNTLYANKLNDIKSDRTNTVAYLGTVQVIQNKILSSLSTADDAIKNGKYIYYIGQKVPQIFSNISKAAMLAADKPYLIAYWNSTGSLLIARVAGLQSFISDFVLSNREDILIDQVKRDQFIYTTYRDINTIYTISAAMVQLFEQVNFQEAVNHVVPYNWYLNMDKSIVNNTIQRFKF